MINIKCTIGFKKSQFITAKYNIGQDVETSGLQQVRKEKQTLSACI